ncbi:MAG: ABC transporter substrate-binding protein [Chloroflexota bacterium]
MSTHGKLAILIIVLMIAPMVLAACGPTPEPQIVIQTVEVEKEVKVIETVEVEKEVKVVETVEVEKEVKVIETVEVQVPAQRTDIRIMMAIPVNAEVVMEDLLDRFESANPDINVILDVVPYPTILEILPLQLETGEGPDIAKVSNIAGLYEYYLDMRPYLSEPAYWEENMGLTMQHMNPDGGNRISGFYTDVTVTGAFINRTLFEQAGVPVPSDTSDKVTWEEWAEAARQVRDATGVDFAMAIDRSGHRVSTLTISQGAKLFDEDGNFVVDDEGMRRALQLMLDWHADGTMPLDVWAGGDSYREATAEFINGNLVFMMSGVWNVGPFTDQIGDAFDWEVVPNPCGAVTCTGMPGGSVMAAMKATKHPEEVARVMEFLAAEENYHEWAARALYIPQHNGIMAKGVDYATDLPQALRAFQVFGEESTHLDPLAYRLQNHLFGYVVMNAIRDRLTQAIVGELTLDEAIARMQADIDGALAAAGN